MTIGGRVCINRILKKNKTSKPTTVKVGREKTAMRQKKSGIKKRSVQNKLDDQQNHPINSGSSILINDDPLGHTLDNLCIKLDCVIPREANLFGEVIRQYIHQIGISVGIEKRFVRELRILVAEA
jgi:hypothetical protein